MVSTRSSDSPSVSFETSPSAETVDKFIKLLSRCFGKVPLSTAFITEIDGVAADTSPSTLTEERLSKHFNLGIPAAAKANILLLHDQDFKCAALVEPPDFCGIPPSQHRKHPGPILSEWRSTIRQLKAKHLALPETGPRSWDTPAAPSQSSGGPGEDPYPGSFNKDSSVETRSFYHIALVARDPDLSPTQHEAAFKAIVGYVLERAQKEDVPVWAEASQLERRAEYEKLGFNITDEVTIGKGKVNGQGWPTSSGTGVTCWGLLYDSA
jgi:hypothetical protein